MVIKKPYFAFCPHSCKCTNPEDLRVFWMGTTGSSLTSHMKAKDMHPTCPGDRTCRAFQTDKSDKLKIRERNLRKPAGFWKRNAEKTFVRYASKNEVNLDAVKAIPKRYLGPDEIQMLTNMCGGPESIGGSNDEELSEEEALPDAEAAMVAENGFVGDELHIIIIEDPERSSELYPEPDADGETTLWVEDVDLPTEFVNYVRSKWSAMVHDSKKGHGRYTVWEWVLVAFAVRLRIRSLELMSWDDYMGAMQEGKGPSWESMIRADMVFGGLGVHGDFLNTEQIGSIAAVNFKRWLKSAKDLGNLFPPPGQLLFRGSKLSVIQMLQRSAAEVTKTPYPKVINLGQPSHADLQELAKRKWIYIKRGFSEGGFHTGFASEDLERLEQRLGEAQTYYAHTDVADEGVRPVWFGLSYIPGFLKGEVRVFFVNGRFEYMILTGLGDISEVTEIVGLNGISEAPNMADGGCIDSEQLQKSTSAFLTFAEDTYNALVKYEEEIYKPSSLRVLCRLDITVLKSQETGEYSWFVNETATSHLCGLFLEHLPRSKARAVASSYGNAIIHFASGHPNLDHNGTGREEDKDMELEEEDSEDGSDKGKKRRSLSMEY